MASTDKPRLHLRDLLFRIVTSTYSFPTSSSSLKLGEKLCMVCIPLIGLIDAFIFSLAGCFDRHRPPHLLPLAYDDVVRLAANSPFNVNEVEALRELFNKLSSSILDDGFIHKEEQRLALFKTKAGENLFLDRAFDVFDEKKNGVIEFEEFVHALSVFHPYAPLEDKIDFAFRLYDLRQTGYMERDEVRQMVVAALQESSIQVPDETLEAIVDKTFEDADAKEDERISKRRMESFCHSESGPPEEHDTSILERCHNCFPKFYFQHRSRRLKTLAKPYGIDRCELPEEVCDDFYCLEGSPTTGTQHF